MIRRENLPFIVVLGALAAVFIAVIVWVHGNVSAKGTVDRELTALRKEHEELVRKDWSERHQEAVQEQLIEAKTNFEKLKERLALWWDGDVYDEEATPRNPTPFLGRLQDLRRQIRTLAEEHKPYPVLLAQGVENMAFLELGTDKDLPPASVTYDLVKQRSIMRDIMALLIENDVESIDAVSWGGKVKGEDLYDKYLVTVKFTCKYPSLAKFQSDLLSNSKVSVSSFGELPRNMFVIEDLAYVTEDQKVAQLAQAAGVAAGGGRSTGGTTTTTNTGGRYGDPGRGPGRGPGRNPADPGSTIRRPGGTGSMRPGGRPPGRTTGGTTVTRVREETTRTDIPGRMPAYNILSVQMTIAMVDFTEPVTGKPDTLEEDKDKKKTTSSTSGSRANAADGS